MKIPGLFPVLPPDTGKTAGRAAGAEGAAARVLSAGLGGSGPAGIAGKAGALPEAVSAKIQTDTLQNLLSALKIPNDSLSESLVSFFRFFSLSLEPGALGAARRGSLSQPKREAAALALATAADKGLVLEGRALTEYADAISGIGARSGEGGGDGAEPGSDSGASNGGDDGSNGNGAGYGGGQGHGGAARDGEKQPPPRPMDTEARNRADGAPSAGEIRETSADILEKRPVLDFINRIPGKRGRWMAFPFSFSSGELDLDVSFRVFSGGTEERLATDVSVKRKNGRREPEGNAETRWWFLLDKGRRRMEIAREPPAGDSRKLVSRIAGLFGLSPDRVVIRDDMPLFADAKDHLRSVDEEV